MAHLQSSMRLRMIFSSKRKYKNNPHLIKFTIMLTKIKKKRFLKTMSFQLDFKKRSQSWHS